MVNETGNVIIIPDENVILADYYQKQIFRNHLEAFMDFSEKYNLGYNFTLSDYQNAPINLAEDGHLIIKTLEKQDILIMYIPKLITDRQILYITQTDLLDKYKTVGAYVLNDDEIDHIYGKSDILKTCNNKNIDYYDKGKKI